MIFLKTTALALVLSAGLFIGSSQAATADEIEAPKLTRSVITAEIEGIKAQALAIKQKATAVMAFLVAHDLKATPAQAQIVKKTINTDSVSAILKGFGLNLDSFPEEAASGGFMSAALSEDAQKAKAALVLAQRNASETEQLRLEAEAARIGSLAEAEQIAAAQALFDEQQIALTTSRSTLEAAERDLVDIRALLKAATDKAAASLVTIADLEVTLKEAEDHIAAEGTRTDAAVHAEIESAKAHIQELVSKHETALKAEIDAKNTAEEEVGRLQGEFEALSTVIKELTDSLDAAQKEAAKVARLTQDVTDLDAERARLNDSLLEETRKVALLEDEVAALKAAADTPDAGLQQARDDLDSAVATVADLEQRIKDHEAHTDEALLKIRAAEAVIAEREATIQILDGKIEALETAASTSTGGAPAPVDASALSDLQSQLDTALKQRDDQVALANEYDTETDKATEERDFAQGQVTHLQGLLDSLHADLKSDVTKGKSTAANLKKTIAKFFSSSADA